MSLPTERAADPDWSALPAAHAVVVFEAADGRTLLIATSARARDFARRRLEQGETLGRAADLRAITNRVLAFPVGSAFEAELVYLTVARARLPIEHRAITERWRAWWLRIDPAEPFPRWTRTNLAEEVGAPPAALLGPVADKDAAGRLIECLVDAFDLCRYHNILVQAPHGAPCAYKEMGRCPAPCDGSETLHDYRARSQESVGFLARGIDPGRNSIERRIADANAAGDPALAALHQRRLARLGPILKPAFARMASIDRFRWLLVVRAGTPGHARAFLCRRGIINVLAEVDTSANRIDTAPLRTALERSLASPLPPRLDSGEHETIGLVCRRLFAPRARRTLAIVPLANFDRTPPTSPELSRALRAAASTPVTRDENAEILLESSA